MLILLLILSIEWDDILARSPCSRYEAFASCHHPIVRIDWQEVVR